MLHRINYSNIFLKISSTFVYLFLLYTWEYENCVLIFTVIKKENVCLENIINWIGFSFFFVKILLNNFCFLIFFFSFFGYKEEFSYIVLRPSHVYLYISMEKYVLSYNLICGLTNEKWRGVSGKIILMDLKFVLLKWKRLEELSYYKINWLLGCKTFFQEQKNKLNFISFLFHLKIQGLMSVLYFFLSYSFHIALILFD